MLRMQCWQRCHAQLVSSDQAHWAHAAVLEGAQWLTNVARQFERMIEDRVLRPATS